MLKITETNWKKVFFTIWTGQAFSLVGSQLIHFAIAWWLTQTTGSAWVLVSVPLFSMIPNIVLGPFVGALVDRWDRRKVMIIADSIIALFSLWLAIMFLIGNTQLWFLFVMAFVRGLGGTFHWTAMQASTSLMVPKDQLARVQGMNQTLQGVMNIAAPPLGALAVAVLPIWAIMLIDVATAVIAIIPLLIVRIPNPEVAPVAVTPKVVLNDVREGLRFVWSWPGLMIVLLMAVLINFLLTPTGSLMPLLITRHFNGGAWHFSAMESGWGIGIIAGGLLLATWGGFKRKVYTSMGGLILMSLAGMAIGLAPANMFWLAVAGNVLGGITNPLVNGPLFAILQARIAPEMQGRVFTLIGSVSSAMAPLGMMLAAPVADNLGIRVWWWIGGLACLAMGLLGLVVPAVLHLEDDAAHGVMEQAPAAEVLPAD